MSTAAIICEFNPFHNGHKYLINKVKNEHADTVVAIMSGHFVQRGDVAITDKYTRAKVALENGCDLVVELPTIYAISGANTFANGGVGIAKALNVDKLCFGAENDNIDKLKDIADAQNCDKFASCVKELMDKGEYYPKAVSVAIDKLLSQKHADILSGANNTLGIEYIKALSNCNIEPVAIKRIGVSHDSQTTNNTYASASLIRKLINKKEEYNSYTDMVIDNPSTISNLETAILYKLKTMTKEEIQNLPDVSEGLHNRIYKCVREYNSLEEILLNLKTKRYTMARLRRIVICALLSITKDIQAESPQYIRVLGMNDKGAQLLKNSTLPIVAKVKQDYDKLSYSAQAVFDIDTTASDVFMLSTKDNNLNDFNKQLIKI